MDDDLATSLLRAYADAGAGHQLYIGRAPRDAEVVPCAVLADADRVRALVLRATNINAPPDQPDVSVDVRAASSRFLRQYARATVYPLMVALATGLAIDLSLSRCAMVIARNVPNGLVIDSVDFDGGHNGPVTCAERVKVSGGRLLDLASLRAAVYERYFAANIEPLRVALDSFVRVSPRLHWSNIAECFALIAESAVRRLDPERAAMFVADRDDILERDHLPGVQGVNPLRHEVKWEPAAERSFLVRSLCCICFTIGDRLGRYCPTCPLISLDELAARQSEV